MVFLTIFQHVANSSALTAAAVAATGISTGVMLGIKSPAVDKFGAGPVPDLWFGFASPGGRLNEFYDGLGEDGRRAFDAVAHWDLFPHMLCYTVLLGSLLVRVARRAGVREGIAYLMPVVMLCDLVETVVLKRGCEQFPEILDGNVVAIGSIANQIKWILLVFALGTIASLFAAGYVKTARKGLKSSEEKSR